jgi:LPXTG-motif cell wall-anchored protein
MSRSIKRLIQFSSAFMIGAVFLGTIGLSQKFENQFIEFKIPENWKCGVEGTEWVCMSDNPRIKKETIVVFAAKVAGSKDTLKEYNTYLKKARNITDLEGKAIKSQVRYTRHKNIGGHTWVDSLHINGEIPGFITRYLATTYQELGILITYSVLESRWDAYESLFRSMVDSMKPRRGTEPEVTAGNKADMTTIPITSLLEREEPAQEEPEDAFEVSQAPEPEEEDSNMAIILILLLLGAGVVFFLMKKKKSSGDLPEDDEGEYEEEDEEDEDN